MGYEMPIVCKRVILPMLNDVSGLTLDEYKEKYGVDLRDYLDFNDANGNIIIKKNIFSELLIATTNYAVRPLQLIYFDGPQSSDCILLNLGTRVEDGTLDFLGNGGMTIVQYNKTSKTLELIEY